MSYSEEDLQYILDNYFLLKIKDIAAHLNRSVNSIKHKAMELNLVKHNHFTDDDILLIKQYHDLLYFEDLQQLIGNFGYNSFAHQCKKMNINKPIRKEKEKKKSKLEDSKDYIIENYHGKTNIELCTELQTNEYALNLFVNKLKIPKKLYIWKDSDTEYLNKNIGVKNIREMSEELGCSLLTVTNNYNKLKKQNLITNTNSINVRQHWSTKDKKYILRNFNKLPIEKMMLTLNRTQTSIHSMYYALKNENNSITGYTRMNAWSEKDKKIYFETFFFCIIFILINTHTIYISTHTKIKK